MNFLRIILFLSLSVSVYGQNINFNKGQAIKKNYYTEISYKLVRGKIIIPVVLEGNTYQFLLDTGAPNLITSNLNDIIDTKFLKKVRVNDANNNKMHLNVVSLPKITIGQVSFKNIPTIVNSKSTNFIFDCFKIDGIIGSNMLRKSVIQFLPRENLIRLSNSKDQINYNENNALDLSLNGKQSSPYIWIDLQGDGSAKEHVLFDTGMKGFYDLSKKNYNILKEKNIFLKIAEGTGVESIGLLGPSKKSKQYRLLTPQIGIHKGIFKNITTTTTSSNHSRIGSEILKYGNVTLDFKNKKFDFSPFQKTIDLNEKILGISSTIINNKIVVGFVWDEKLKNEIYYGDTIISINGKNFVDVDVCEIITKESILNTSDSFEIEYRDSEGMVKKIKLNKEFPSFVE